MEKPYERRTFKLLKDGPTMKKGALVQERCDDGTQPYDMLNNDTHSKDPSYKISFANRSLVEDQPQWFVEVFKVPAEYLTKEQLAQWEAFKKAHRTVTKTVAKRGRPVGSKNKKAGK